MRYLMIFLLLFSACSTYVTENERRELDQSARSLFPDKKITGTRVTRKDERYTVKADVEGGLTITLYCQRYQNDDGQYWKCVKSYF